jgi:hypothetical protein
MRDPSGRQAADPIEQYLEAVRLIETIKAAAVRKVAESQEERQALERAVVTGEADIAVAPVHVVGIADPDVSRAKRGQKVLEGLPLTGGASALVLPSSNPEDIPHTPLPPVPRGHAPMPAGEQPLSMGESLGLLTAAAIFVGVAAYALGPEALAGLAKVPKKVWLGLSALELAQAGSEHDPHLLGVYGMVATAPAIVGELAAAGTAGATVLSTAQKGALLQAATQPFKDTALTQAGRALTKHPELVGLTKETLKQTLRSDAALNAAAEGALGGILHSGTAVTRSSARFGTVIDVTAPSGFGARFSATGEFIGFLNP